MYNFILYDLKSFRFKKFQKIPLQAKTFEIRYFSSPGECISNPSSWKIRWRDLKRCPLISKFSKPPFHFWDPKSTKLAMLKWAFGTYKKLDYSVDCQGSPNYPLPTSHYRLPTSHSQPPLYPRPTPHSQLYSSHPNSQHLTPHVPHSPHPTPHCLTVYWHQVRKTTPQYETPFLGVGKASSVFSAWQTETVTTILRNYTSRLVSACLYICLPVCMFVSVSVSVYLFVSLFVYFCKSACLTSVCMWVFCFYECRFVSVYLFKILWDFV